MYYVSFQMNPIISSQAIHIIDGQNINQIQQYISRKFNNEWNPCIPIPFTQSVSITITFGVNISNLCDWYPSNICDYDGNVAHYPNNHYLFDGGKSITINNLNINDYIINNNTNYPIIRSNDYYNASVLIKNGSFINISSSSPNPLFLTKSSIYIKNSVFIDMEINKDLFYAYHGDQDLSATRSFVFDNVSFQNVSAQMIFESTWSWNDVK